MTESLPIAPGLATETQVSGTLAYTYCYFYCFMFKFLPFCVFSFFPGFSVLFWKDWSLTSKEIILASVLLAFLVVSMEIFLILMRVFTYLLMFVSMTDNLQVEISSILMRVTYVCSRSFP